MKAARAAPGTVLHKTKPPALSDWRLSMGGNFYLFFLLYCDSYSATNMSIAISRFMVFFVGTQYLN